MKKLHYLILLLFVLTVGFARIEYKYTGITYSHERNMIGDIKMDINRLELSWNFLAGNGFRGSFGLGGTDMVVTARYTDPVYDYSDLNSNGRFAANLHIAKYFGPVFMTTGVRYFGISGNMEVNVDPSFAVSEFDKFIQKNKYQFYEFPVGAGIYLQVLTLGVSAGYHRSLYYGNHDYTQYIYQGLTNVETDSRSYTFKEQDEDGFVDLEISLDIGSSYQVRVGYTFPYVKGNIKSGMDIADKSEMRLFLGKLIP